MPVLVDRPTLYPAACAVCGTNLETAGPYLDAEYESVDDCHVYYCANHTAELAAALSLVPADTAAKAQAARAESEALVRAQLAEVRRAHAANEQLAAKVVRLEAAVSTAQAQERAVRVCLDELKGSKTTDRRAELLAAVTPKKTTTRKAAA